MANIKVPEKHHGALKKLLHLSESVFESMVKAIATIPIKTYPESTLLTAIKKVKSINGEDAKILRDFLVPFCVNHSSSDKEALQYVESIRSLEVELGISKKDWDIVKSRLTTILNVKPLILSAKATAILHEYERTFGRTRVLTDIRPIFDTTKDANLEAGIVIHTLNIHYHQEGEHKDFFVTLDDNDLDMLIFALERAKAKAQNLKQHLKKTKLMCIDIN